MTLRLTASNDGERRASFSVRYRLGVEALVLAGLSLVDEAPGTETKEGVERVAARLSKGEIEKRLRRDMSSEGYHFLEYGAEQMYLATSGLFEFAQQEVERRVRHLWRKDLV